MVPPMRIFPPGNEAGIRQTRIGGNARGEIACAPYARVRRSVRASRDRKEYGPEGPPRAMWGRAVACGGLAKPLHERPAERL